MPFWHDDVKVRLNFHVFEDGEGMEAKITGCTLGIPYNIQDTHWNVTLSAHLWENLPFTRRAGAQSALGYPKMEYGSKTSQRVSEASDLETGGMERQSLL